MKPDIPHDQSHAQPSFRKIAGGIFVKIAPWVAAAALAVAAIRFATQNLALRTEAESLRTERLLAEIAYKTGQHQLAERTLLAEKIINDLGGQLRRSQDLARLKLIALAPPGGGTGSAQIIVVWDPAQQTGLLTTANLPALADHQAYQIWVSDSAHPQPVSAGVFHVNADGGAAIPIKPGQPVAHATGFAITLEKKGGAPQAEGPVLFRGN